MAEQTVREDLFSNGREGDRLTGIALSRGSPAGIAFHRKTAHTLTRGVGFYTVKTGNDPGLLKTKAA